MFKSSLLIASAAAATLAIPGTAEAGHRSTYYGYGQPYYGPAYYPQYRQPAYAYGYQP